MLYIVVFIESFGKFLGWRERNSNECWFCEKKIEKIIEAMDIDDDENVKPTTYFDLV